MTILEKILEAIYALSFNDKVLIAVAIIGVLYALSCYLFVRFGEDPGQDEHETNFQ